MTVAPQPLASRETVLIIEDHEDHLEISRTVLQDDYRVVWATTAAEGKRKALEENPSLVLVDLSLPDQDGTTLVAALKAEPRLRGVPMLAFTARNQPSDKLEAFDIGFDGYLAKPVRPAQLLESVAVHLARRKVRGRSRVLLGEQNETSARVLSEHLSRLDLEVLSARNGEEALRFLQAGEIDLLLVNTDLPGHSGYDLCRLQKGEQAGAFRPVILFSSGYNQNSMNRAFEAGADDYLVNPKSMEELSSRVTALLRLQELTSTLSRLNGEIKDTKKWKWAGSVASVPGEWDYLAWVGGDNWDQVWKGVEGMNEKGWRTETLVPIKSWWNKSWKKEWWAEAAAR